MHRISGFEALMRWQQPEGDILPDRFIAVAEETGLIIEIGEIVLRKTCEQMQQLREAGFLHQKVSVNLSEKQFRDKNLIDMVSRVLGETKFDASGLQFEVTDISSALISLAKHLHMSVAAEGVENAEQVAFLKDHHCSLQQGFLFSAPISIAELIPKLSLLQDSLKDRSAQNVHKPIENDVDAIRH